MKKKSFFIIEKIQKYLKCPALWPALEMRTNNFQRWAVTEQRQRQACVCGQSWALEVFLNFLNDKNWFFADFIKLIWLGVGFLNRTDAKIGY